MLERCKSRNLGPRKNVPDNRSLAHVVADNQPPRTALAHIIHRDEIDTILVTCKATFHGQSIMVQA